MSSLVDGTDKRHGPFSRNPTAAKGQLGALKNSTAAQIQNGKLTRAQGETIIAAAADRILGTLG